MSTIFGVWKDFKVYMSDLQVSTDLDLDLYFMINWIMFRFWVLLFYYETISKNVTMFGVWDDCKLHMSIFQGSSDLHRIFFNHWTLLICSWFFFSWLLTHYRSSIMIFFSIGDETIQRVYSWYVATGIEYIFSPFCGLLLGLWFNTFFLIYIVIFLLLPWYPLAHNVL